jgi:hypothetical protein
MPCSDFLEIREDLQLQYPSLTPEYLEGSNEILATACNLTDIACL